MNINIKTMNSLENGLYIVSTPIGNLEDITTRAQNVLNMVDFIICENPNHSLKLLNKLGIKKKLFSLHDYNEKNLIKRIQKYQNNSAIALISDAGSPLISDPGYNLVLDFINKDLFVTSVPGASSIISALQLCGLPIHNFKFFGFVSKNKQNINNLINEIKSINVSTLFFISGQRLLDFLGLMLKYEVNRRLAVCKEITKKNEMVFRGDISKVIDQISSNKKYIKGEFVVIVEGAPTKISNKLNEKNTKQISKLLKKFSLTEVVQIVHNLTGISRKEIYKETLLLKND